jgi:hypothetical protein
MLLHRRFTESEVAELMKQADAGRASVPYAPTPADLAAQAAADRNQEQADRDCRELALLALATEAGACRCGAVKAPCLGCRVAVAGGRAVGGGAAAIRFLLNHFDEVSQPAMRRELLPEVNDELARRGVSRRPPAA